MLQPRPRNAKGRPRAAASLQAAISWSTDTSASIYSADDQRMTTLDRRPGYSALAGGMVAFARVDQLVRRGMDAARRGLGALLAEAMTADELRTLSAHLYGSLM